MKNHNNNTFAVMLSNRSSTQQQQQQQQQQQREQNDDDIESSLLSSSSHSPSRRISNHAADYEYDNNEYDNEDTPLITRNTPKEGSIQSGLQMNVPPLPGMKIRCHRLSRKDGSLSVCSTKEALSGAKNGRDHYWIDIEHNPNRKDDAEELKEWLQELKSLPNFVVDVLSEPSDAWASQVIPLPKAILAIVRILPEAPESDETPYLAALGLRNMLITFTATMTSASTYSLYPYGSSNENGSGNGSIGLYGLALQRMKQAERLPAPTSSGALLAWLRFHLDRTSRSTRDLRNHVLAMDEAMDRDIHNVKLEEIISAKDQLLRLLSVAEEQGECLESLAAATIASTTDNHHNNTIASASHWFSPSLKGSLSVLLATAGSTERMTLRLEKHIMDLRQRCENYQHTKMNRRLGVLTVLSAVFLPLTLFTGIWGMNFEDMPELTEPYAYPLALSFMLCLAFVMIYYFRKTGWFE